MREQAENLRRQHNVSQAGDSTFSWELLTEADNAPQFTLGSLGRFFHHTYGLILARYVQFADMNDEAEWTGAPLGYHHSQAPFMWRVTNDLAKSRADLVMGVSGAYVTPKDAQFGWMIVNGVNIQALLSTSIPVRFARFSWKATSRVELVGEHSGPPLARLFGNQWVARGDGPWWIPPGQAYIDTLSLSEAAAIGGFDSVGVEDQIQQLQDLVANTKFTVDYQLDQSSVELQTAREGINLTAKMLQRRMASLGLDSISQEMQETLQAAVTAQSLAITAADNAGAASLITHANLISTNDFKRTAEVSATDAGLFASSATEASNNAVLNANEATLQAQAAATSASNASVSETNAGTSATAASNSATSAATSAGTATTQAGIATTQAGNAATSAGNASTSASQASTSATNAAGSATNAASSATTATNAATTATTQAGVATTQAGNAATSASNASTFASNASTSATQASTSATNAGTSATNASNSATAASTSAVNAASSATGAAGSATAAALTLAKQFPPTVDSAANGYTLTETGADSAAANIPGGDIVLASGRYGIREAAGTHVLQKALLSATAGRIYEISVEFNVVTYAGGNITLTTGVNCLDTALAALAYVNTTQVVTAVGVYSLAIRVSDTANAARSVVAWNASSVWLRPAATWTQSVGGNVVGVRGIAIRDITATVNAETQAAAAATSASNASTSATAAGSSATSANTSATNASTSATNAANSATSASGSASTATTQASNASTSASNAAGSASSASTSATNASNSAATATTQAGTATTQASAANTSASNAATSASAAAGSASTASTQASNASVSAGNAASSATAASTSATNASTSASSASTSATVAANVGAASLFANPVFLNWASGSVPDSFTAFPDATHFAKGSGNLFGSTNTVDVTSTAETVHGFFQRNTSLRSGYYIIEAMVELVTGSLEGALAYIDGTSASPFSTTYDHAFIDLHSDSDITGAVIGAGTTGRIYSFRKLVRLNNINIAVVNLWGLNNFSTYNTVVAKRLRWHKLSVTPADNTDIAVVNTTSNVVVDVGNRISTANFVASTVAGSAAAALRLESKALGGSSSSSLSLEAEEIQLFNNAAGTRALAMKVSSGGVLITGDLDVGKGVKIGSRRIPVALQSFQVSAKDGDAVDFGTDLGNTPVLLFDTTHLVPKTAAQVYDVRANSLTSTGFTMYAKVTTPSGTTSNVMTSSSDAGAGVTPRYQVQKTVTPDAYDGNYTFSVNLNVVFTDNGDGSASGYAEYDCYARTAGAWVFIGTISKNTLKASPAGTFSRNIQGVVNYSGAIGIDGGGAAEFGIVIVASTFVSFNSVTFTSSSTGTTTSASPGGETVTVTVIPQNV